MQITFKDLTRDCGSLEKFYYTYETHRVFQCISISAKLSRPLSAGRAYGALRQLVLKYPSLITRISGGPKLRFEPLEVIYFKDVFQINETIDKCFKDQDAYTKCLTNLSFADRHKQKKPLWKVVYYEKTGWLTFNCSHSFTDGGSVVAYLKDLVETFNHVDGSNTSDIVFSLAADLSLLKNRIPARPSQENRGLRENLKEQISELSFADGFPNNFTRKHLYESDYALDQNSPLNFTAPIFLNIDQNDLRTILRACKINKVKLQSYILVAYVHTVNLICPGTYQGKYLKTGVAASLRNSNTLEKSHGSYLGNAGRFSEGLFSYTATFFLEPNMAFTWDLVRKYHNFLVQRLSKEDSIEQSSAELASKVENSANNPAAGIKDNLFFLCTNLGNIEVMQHENPLKYQIEDFLFAASAGAILGTHHMTVSSTRKNGLNIGFTNGDPNIRDWAKFKTIFAKTLIAFSAEQRQGHL